MPHRTCKGAGGCSLLLQHPSRSQVPAPPHAPGMWVTPPLQQSIVRLAGKTPLLLPSSVPPSFHASCLLLQMGSPVQVF